MSKEDDDFLAMPLDELWRVHEEISQLLFERLTAQYRQLDEKLAILQHRLVAAAAGEDNPGSTKASRRPAGSKALKKPDSRTAKHMAPEKMDS